MPELPDVMIYVERLEALLRERSLRAVHLPSPFVLRSVEPPIERLEGATVIGIRRLGKRVVIEFDAGLFLVIHLMIAGRLRWREPGAKLPGRIALAILEFDGGTLVLTEAGSKKRASMHVVEGEDALSDHDRGGLEVLESDLDAFGRRLVSESHTLKRALTDPRIFSGIGNAYSDEILHQARLSPFVLTGNLALDEVERLYEATRAVLIEWTERLRRETGDGFPEKVTAFREGMAVHGRFRKPCPVCATPVQRIVYAQTEMNYCPTCQTGGRVLADRSLSRLLRDDWPKRAEDLA
jgi:formamidopyrimidine-DNA glycosylase